MITINWVIRGGIMNLESEFNKEMINIYTIAKKEEKYVASRFLQLVSSEGGLSAAKKLISKEGGSDGFTRLWELGRLDLSVEALVLKNKYKSLFSEEEIKISKNRLEAYGYCNNSL